jgi:hypothetical protein
MLGLRATDEVNRLYEAASDLMQAAGDLRDLAHGKRTVPAHPSVLGCIQTALEELGLAVAAIRAATDEVRVGEGYRGQSVKHDVLMHRGFDNLEIALRDAAAAAAAARSLSSRALQPRGC